MNEHVILEYLLLPQWWGKTSNDVVVQMSVQDLRCFVLSDDEGLGQRYAGGDVRYGPNYLAGAGPELKARTGGRACQHQGRAR